jgi:hypothetical protein
LAGLFASVRNPVSPVEAGVEEFYACCESFPISSPELTERFIAVLVVPQSQNPVPLPTHTPQVLKILFLDCRLVVKIIPKEFQKVAVAFFLFCLVCPEGMGIE